MENLELQNQGPSKLCKRLISMAVEFVPGLAQIKLVQEAIRGKTWDGFALNTFERGMYLGSVLMTATSMGVGVWAVHEKDLKDGVMGSALFAGSWCCYGLGKARQLGFSVPEPVGSVMKEFFFDESSR